MSGLLPIEKTRLGKRFPAVFTATPDEIRARSAQINARSPVLYKLFYDIYQINSSSAKTPLIENWSTPTVELIRAHTGISLADIKQQLSPEERSDLGDSRLLSMFAEIVDNSNLYRLGFILPKFASQAQLIAFFNSLTPATFVYPKQPVRTVNVASTTKPSTSRTSGAVVTVATNKTTSTSTTIIQKTPSTQITNAAFVPTLLSSRFERYVGERGIGNVQFASNWNAMILTSPDTSVRCSKVVKYQALPITAIFKAFICEPRFAQAGAAFTPQVYEEIVLKILTEQERRAVLDTYDQRAFDVDNGVEVDFKTILFEMLGLGAYENRTPTTLELVANHSGWISNFVKIDLADKALQHIHTVCGYFQSVMGGAVTGQTRRYGFVIRTISDVVPMTKQELNAEASVIIAKDNAVALATGLKESLNVVIDSAKMTDLMLNILRAEDLDRIIDVDQLSQRFAGLAVGGLSGSMTLKDLLENQKRALTNEGSQIVDLLKGPTQSLDISTKTTPSTTTLDELTEAVQTLTITPTHTTRQNVVISSVQIGNQNEPEEDTPPPLPTRPQLQSDPDDNEIVVSEEPPSYEESVNNEVDPTSTSIPPAPVIPSLAPTPNVPQPAPSATGANVVPVPSIVPNKSKGGLLDQIKGGIKLQDAKKRKLGETPAEKLKRETNEAVAKRLAAAQGNAPSPDTEDDESIKDQSKAFVDQLNADLKKLPRAEALFKAIKETVDDMLENSDEARKMFQSFAFKIRERQESALFEKTLPGTTSTFARSFIKKPDSMVTADIVDLTSVSNTSFSGIMVLYNHLENEKDPAQKNNKQNEALYRENAKNRTANLMKDSISNLGSVSSFTELVLEWSMFQSAQGIMDVLKNGSDSLEFTEALLERIKSHIFFSKYEIDDITPLEPLVSLIFMSRLHKHIGRLITVIPNNKLPGKIKGTVGYESLYVSLEEPNTTMVGKFRSTIRSGGYTPLVIIQGDAKLDRQVTNTKETNASPHILVLAREYFEKHFEAAFACVFGEGSSNNFKENVGFMLNALQKKMTDKVNDMIYSQTGYDIPISSFDDQKTRMTWQSFQTMKKAPNWTSIETQTISALGIDEFFREFKAQFEKLIARYRNICDKKSLSSLQRDEVSLITSPSKSRSFFDNFSTCHRTDTLSSSRYQCALCKVLAQFECSGCHKVYYCGEACRDMHWSIAHKYQCKKTY